MLPYLYIVSLAIQYVIQLSVYHNYVHAYTSFLFSDVDRQIPFTKLEHLHSGILMS